MHTKEEEAVKRRQHKEEERPEGRERPESKGQEEKGDARPLSLSLSLSKKSRPTMSGRVSGQGIAIKMQKSRNIIYRDGLKGFGPLARLCEYCRQA